MRDYTTDFEGVVTPIKPRDSQCQPLYVSPIKQFVGPRTRRAMESIVPHTHEDLCPGCYWCSKGLKPVLMQLFNELMAQRESLSDQEFYQRSLQLRVWNKES